MITCKISNYAIKIGKSKTFARRYSTVDCGVNGANPDRNILT